MILVLLAHVRPDPSMAGDYVIGAGGLSLALAILKLSFNVGRMTQMLDNHDKRITRIEDSLDGGRNRRATDRSES